MCWALYRTCNIINIVKRTLLFSKNQIKTLTKMAGNLTSYHYGFKDVISLLLKLYHLFHESTTLILSPLNVLVLHAYFESIIGRLSWKARQVTFAPLIHFSMPRKRRCCYKCLGEVWGRKGFCQTGGFAQQLGHVCITVPRLSSLGKSHATSTKQLARSARVGRDHR